jgi:hypothetical protein
LTQHDAQFLTELDELLAPGTRREAHHYLAAGNGLHLSDGSPSAADVPRR